jgi:pimeloyl-ACP methyl ester carboxylesterase
MLQSLFVIALLAAPADVLQSPAIADPAIDVAHPAGMAAFVMPTQDGAINALLYTAAGPGPHPTLLLLHGFPGNEQNLDLAQAARRAGWNVLTLHYRGSWGSPGAFSFGHAAEDARTALAWLRDPAQVAKFAIDPARIAVAGHSMGGFMAADAAADDPTVTGLFLLDPWDIGSLAAGLGTPEGRAAWRAEAAADLTPLSGTSAQALADEIVAGAERFNLASRVTSFGNRPLAIYAADRGIADHGRASVEAAREAGNLHVSGGVWETDHSFSDRRIALSTALVDWLGTLQPRD